MRLLFTILNTQKYNATFDKVDHKTKPVIWLLVCKVHNVKQLPIKAIVLQSLTNKLKADRHFNVGLFEFYAYQCVRGMLAF